MISTDKEILKRVRYARDRMHMSKLANVTAKALLVALGFSFLLTFLSRFFPVYNPYGKGIMLTGIITAGGFIFSLFMTPKSQSAALFIDSKGLYERTITALELIDDDSELSHMQKKDALYHLKNMDIKKEIKIIVPKKVLAICGLLAVLILISGFIPNPMKEKAEELHSIKKQIQNQEKEIEEIIKKVENNNKISMTQKKEAIEQLNKLKKEMNKDKDVNETEKALQRTENKIDMLKQKYTDADMDKIIDTFSKNKATKDLADTLKRGDRDKIKKDLKDITKSLQNLKEDDLKKLSESIGELSEALKSNPELAEAFSEFAQKMAEGEFGDLENEMEALGDEIAKLMENSEFQKAMDEAMKQLGAGASQNQGGQGKGGQGQGQGGQGQGQGQGQGGQGQGQGGQGQGQGGGAGSGSGNDGDGITDEGGSSGLGNKGTTGGEIKEYEKVFAPKLLGGEGEKDMLKGSKGEGGQTKIYKTEQGMTIKGEMQPYNQVIGEYKEQAFQNLEGSEIPQGMQGIVKDYFTSLED